MTNEKFCQGCSQRKDCGELYGQLGRLKGSSVAFKVVVAFVIPIMVFIGALAVFSNIAQKITGVETIQTVISFFSAVAVTLICILVIKAIDRIRGKRR